MCCFVAQIYRWRLFQLQFFAACWIKYPHLLPILFLFNEMHIRIFGSMENVLQFDLNFLIQNFPNKRVYWIRKLDADSSLHNGSFISFAAATRKLNIVCSCRIRSNNIDGRVHIGKFTIYKIYVRIFLKSNEYDFVYVQEQKSPSRPGNTHTYRKKVYMARIEAQGNDSIAFLSTFADLPLQLTTWFIIRIKK